MLVAQPAHRAHEFGVRLDQVHVAGEGLDDDAGDFAADPGEGALQSGDVVVVEHDGLCRHFGRYAGRGRVAEGECAGAGLHQQEVGMAVVAAFELDEFAAPGETARQTDRAHGRLGAGRHQPHLLDAGYELGDARGDGQFGFGRCAERQAVGGGVLHRLDGAGVGVAEGGRPPRTDIVDVFAAIGIPYAGAPGATEEHRGAANASESTYRRVDPAGDDLLRLFE